MAAEEGKEESREELGMTWLFLGGADSLGFVVGFIGVLGFGVGFRGSRVWGRV